MSREFLMLVKESSFGVPKANPVLGTDKFYIRLDGNTGFTVDDEPITYEIMYGGGIAIPAIVGTDHYQVGGRLATKAYAGALSRFLLDWAATPIDSGRTTPWPTTDPDGLMPPGDLASVSCYHAILMAEGTYKRTRCAGCKVARWRLGSTRDAPVAAFEFDIQAQRVAATDPDDVEFPAPSEADYPMNPFVFSQTAGNLKIGTTRTQYRTVQVEGTNNLDRQWFEANYLSTMRFTGRRVTLSAELYLKGTPDDKAAHRAMTVQDAELSFVNGANTIKVDFHGSGRITAVARNLPVDGTYTRTVTLSSMRDAVAGTDLTVSGT